MQASELKVEGSALSKRPRTLGSAAGVSKTSTKGIQVPERDEMHGMLGLNLLSRKPEAQSNSISAKSASERHLLSGVGLTSKLEQAEADPRYATQVAEVEPN